MPLPAEYNNPGSNTVNVRWIITSNPNTKGDPIIPTGISKIDDVFVSGTLSADIENIRFSDKIYLYPNPVAEQLNIESPHRIENVIPYNIQGKRIKEFKGVHTGHTAIHINDLPPSIYFLKLEYSNTKTVCIEKFVKN